MSASRQSDQLRGEDVYPVSVVGLVNATDTTLSVPLWGNKRIKDVRINEQKFASGYITILNWNATGTSIVVNATFSATAELGNVTFEVVFFS